MLHCYILLYIDIITREIRVYITLDTLDLYKQYAYAREEKCNTQQFRGSGGRRDDEGKRD